MFSRLLAQLRARKTLVVSVAAFAVLIAAVIVVPQLGGDSDKGVKLEAEPGEPGFVQEGASPLPGVTPTAVGTATAGPTAPGAGGTTAPGATSPTTGGAAPPPALKAGPIGNTRGVTATKIKIGVALPDLSAFAAISENFDVGDTREQMEAILDGWKRDGLLPVHGRTIEFVYREFDILSSQEEIAACQDFIEEEKVFAVVAGRFFEDGAECVTVRFKTPLVTIDSALQATYQRGAPYFFTIRPSLERLFKNWVRWADIGGHLKGKRIGLFYETENEDAVEVGIKKELARRGYKITEEVGAAGAGIGTSQDQVAVRRFQDADVNLVMLVVGGTSANNFMTFAESQDYHPTYIDTDVGEHTTDAATSIYPENQYDKTFAMTTTRIGEVRAGFRLPAATTKCVSNYERFSGKEIGPSTPETAEYNNTVVSCDMANAMFRGIQLAGRGLGHLSLVRALESVSNLPLAAHGDLTFTPGRHHGISAERTVQWARGCRCWKAFGSFRAFTL